MLRAIHEIKPDWVVGENVAGILTMVQPGQETEVGSQPTLFSESNPVYKRQQEYVVETICRDLEREGYSVQPVLIPACSVGAPHRRDRVWFIATVTAQDYKLRGPNSSQQGLPEIIRAMLLPTPLATEIHHPERVHKWKQAHAPSLHSQLNGKKKPNGLSDFLDFYGMLLPTPVASDAGVGAVMGKNDRIIVTPKGKIRKINQKGHVWSVGLGRMAELLPTPTARDWKGAASLESLEKRGRIPEKNSLPDFFARTGKSFQLNPLFVAEMMGFPPSWTILPFLSEEKNPSKDTETPSSPR